MQVRDVPGTINKKSPGSGQNIKKKLWPRWSQEKVSPSVRAFELEPKFIRAPEYLDLLSSLEQQEEEKFLNMQSSYYCR